MKSLELFGQWMSVYNYTHSVTMSLHLRCYLRWQEKIFVIWPNDDELRYDRSAIELRKNSRFRLPHENHESEVIEERKHHLKSLQNISQVIYTTLIFG